MTRVYFLDEMGEPRARHAHERSIQTSRVWTRPMEGQRTIGTETVTAQPGERTVIYPTHQNALDPLPHGRTAPIATHG